eukprot:365273-Chlamydomonas_euryale.AAC.7
MDAVPMQWRHSEHVGQASSIHVKIFANVLEMLVTMLQVRQPQQWNYSCACMHSSEPVCLPTIVNDDLLIADARVGSRHFAAAFDEEAVGLLHDVRLVDSSDLLALVVDCVLESKLSNTAGRLACDDLS